MRSRDSLSIIRKWTPNLRKWVGPEDDRQTEFVTQYWFLMYYSSRNIRALLAICFLNVPWFKEQSEKYRSSLYECSIDYSTLKRLRVCHKLQYIETHPHNHRQIAHNIFCIIIIFTKNLSFVTIRGPTNEHYWDVDFETLRQSENQLNPFDLTTDYGKYKSILAILAKCNDRTELERLAKSPSVVPGEDAENLATARDEARSANASRSVSPSSSKFSDDKAAPFSRMFYKLQYIETQRCARNSDNH